MADLSKPLRTMKRILILLLALMPVMASAQKVTSNERDEKGIRTITTGSRAFFVERDMHMCQLSYMEEDGKGYYNIMFLISEQTSQWVVKPGQKILMKDSNGEVYTIVANGLSESQLTRSIDRGVCYCTATSYLLNDETSKVIDNGLVKIRIEYTYHDNGHESIMDIDIPSDLTNYLKKAKKNIDKTIPLPVTIDKSVF